MEENYDDSFYDNSRYKYKSQTNGDIKKTRKTLNNDQTSDPNKEL